MKIMKFTSLVLSAAIVATACNSKAPDTTTTPTADTGLVIMKPELPADSQQTETTPAAAPAKGTAPASKKANNSTATTDNAATGNGATTAPAGDGTAATTAEAKEEKKGWSKTAKGAVIGGVTGAAAGAVINKKNRGAGAVIGGVTGAAAGAVIGNEMDKKDGRRQ